MVKNEAAGIGQYQSMPISALNSNNESFVLNGKRYQCSQCSKVLSSKQNLNEHMFTHSGAKPYVCREPGCGMSFRQGSQLSAHKRIHLAVKNFSTTKESIVGKRYLKLSLCLQMYPGILEEKDQTEEIKVETDSLKLPSISSPQESVILPSSILGGNLNAI